MTLHEEPPVVDLDELLDEQTDEHSGATAGQWTLVVVGGAIGIAGLLGLLVVVSPAILELVKVIHMFSAMVNGN